MEEDRNMIRALCLAVVAVGSVGLLAGCGSEKSGAGKEALLCYVGGTMRPALEALAADYEAKTGQKVLIDSADSGELLTKIELMGKSATQRGDLYVCHDPFMGALMKKGLGVKGWTVASLTPVIAVPKGNPKGILGLKDLAKPGVKVMLTDAVHSTAGYVVAVMAKKAGIEKELSGVPTVRSGTEAANNVVLGTVDAAICWNAVVFARRDKLDAVEIDKEYRPVRDVDVNTSATYGRINLDYVRVTVATLRFSKNLAAAKAFAEFVASSEAAKTWAKLGYSPADPSRMDAEAPPTLGGTVFVHCAAGMQMPIARIADEFHAERGTLVQLNYGGSNTLLGQIELTKKGDVYVAGDADYVDMAAKKGLVKSQKTVCYFVPVIVVKKGNPLGIKTLSDLAKEGRRIGQGDEKAAAVGRIMPKLLELNGVDAAAWSKNVVLSTATVNELAMKAALGTIDGAVVWQSIAAQFAKDTDAVPIDRSKNVCPQVAAAVLTTAENAKTAEAFLAFMTSARGRQILTESGYTVDKP